MKQTVSLDFSDTVLLYKIIRLDQSLSTAWFSIKTFKAVKLIYFIIKTL